MVDYGTLMSKWDTTNNKVILNREHIALNDFAASLAFDKKLLFYGINVFANFSSLNGFKQKQLGIIFSTFPKGNLNLYTLSTIVFHKSNRGNSFIFEQTAGVKIYKYLWTDGFITLGQLENYTEQNAYVVNNLSENIDSRFGLSFIVPFKKFKFSIRYQMQQKSSPFNFYHNGVRLGLNNYNDQLIIGTFTWIL
jgi:hypothetical protein